jgi:UrcA family protein
VLCAAASVSLFASADGYTETVILSKADGLRTAAVSYADLNLTSPTGRAVLQRRLSQAAELVCGSGNWRQAGSLQQSYENRKCQKRAVLEAMDHLAATQLASTSE